MHGDAVVTRVDDLVADNGGANGEGRGCEAKQSRTQRIASNVMALSNCGSMVIDELVPWSVPPSCSLSWQLCICKVSESMSWIAVQTPCHR